MRSLILEIPRRILRVTSDVELEVATIDPKEIYTSLRLPMNQNCLKILQEYDTDKTSEYPVKSLNLKICQAI